MFKVMRKQIKLKKVIINFLNIDNIYATILEFRIDQYLDKNWNWIGAKDSKGYGQISIKGKAFLVHRLLFQNHINLILPRNIHVCHIFDNPECCNPIKLFSGTSADNMKDRAQKGRSADRKGQQNGRAKLTKDDVLKIRKLYIENNISRKNLAKMFNVSKILIAKIVTRKLWTHI